MNIIKEAAYPIEDNLNLYKKIELCGRTCYRSEDKITDASAVRFVQAMVKNKHTAMLEHAHIYCKAKKTATRMIETWLTKQKFEEKAENIMPYINISQINDINYISGSLRTILTMFEAYIRSGARNLGMESFCGSITQKYPEIFGTDILPFKFEPCMKPEKVTVFENADEFCKDVANCINDQTKINNILKKHLIHTIVFICDRGVSHEFVRHRPASFAQESTRYCNYVKDKFGKEITVIEPFFYDRNSVQYDMWKTGCLAAERAYFDLIESGSTPQEARSVLPNSLKTQLVITATEIEWLHIINLRYYGVTGAPHPQIKKVMELAMPYLNEMSNQRLPYSEKVQSKSRL